jgi:hypothetical protein
VSEERRSEPRTHALKSGQIVFGEPQERQDCLVWDLGKSGAMIEVEPEVSIPEEFRLISAGLALSQICEVIWRDGRKIVVRFVI